MENKENKQNNFKDRYNKILSDKSLKIENTDKKRYFLQNY